MCQRLGMKAITDNPQVEPILFLPSRLGRSHVGLLIG